MGDERGWIARQYVQSLDRALVIESDGSGESLKVTGE